MNAKKESKVWEAVRKYLKIRYLKRIENKVEPGWPDVFFHDKETKNCGWIELKIERSWPTHIDFEPGQPVWHDEYWKQGGRCFVLLYTDKEKLYYLWDGRCAKALAKSNTFKDCAFAISGNGEEFWNAFKKHITFPQLHQ